MFIRRKEFEELKQEVWKLKHPVPFKLGETLKSPKAPKEYSGAKVVKIQFMSGFEGWGTYHYIWKNRDYIIDNCFCWKITVFTKGNELTHFYAI